MPETGLDAARRARIEAAVTGGPAEQLWSVWTTDGSDDEGFDTAYAGLMTWARIDPTSALKVLQALRRRGMRVLDASQRARLVRLHGHLLRANGRFREAAVQYADATDRFEAEGERAEVLRTAIGRVDVLAMLDEFDAALELARRARRGLARREPVLTARLDVNVAALLHRIGRPKQAVESYRRARRVLKRAGLDADVALVDFDLGQSLLELGRVAEAERTFHRSHAAFDARGFIAQALRARFGLATARIQRGHWDEGFDALQEIHTALESIGDEQAVAALRWELSRVWGAFGDLDRALEEARGALEVYDRLGVGRDAAHVARWSARWLRDLGRLSDARVLLERAQGHFETIGDRDTLRRIEVDLAGILVAEERDDETRTLLTGLQSALDRSDPPTALRCRVLLAGIDERQQRHRSAVRRGRRARDDARGPLGRLERPGIALILARAEAGLGHAGPACRWAKRAARDLEDLAGATDDEALRRTLWTRRADVVRDAVDIVLTHGGDRADRDALDMLIRARSREVIEALLAEMPAMSREARARIAMLRQELLDAGDGPQGDVRTRAIARDVERLDQDVHRRLQHRFAVVRRTSESARLSNWSPRVRGQSVVVFERVARRWCAFVIEAQRVRRVDLDVDDESLRTLWRPLQLLFEAASGMPTARRRRFLERTRDEATERLRALGEAMWAPLDIAHDRVHVILPADLHDVPVEAAGELYHRDRTLVASRWPHPALIRTDRPRRRGAAVLLHDGTEGRRREVDEIARSLTPRGTSVIRGTERARVDEADTVGLFHVAAHGAVSRGHWIGTGILLGDGWLGLEEIAGDRRYRDATLFFASCASGQQSLRPQGRFDGWVSAGLGSGAREIVLALWKIDDRVSTEFTRSFYRSWSAYVPAPEAASAARREAIAEERHPYGWATFTVVG